jgi:CheY-like chemotaxis protein
MLGELDGIRWCLNYSTVVHCPRVGWHFSIGLSPQSEPLVPLHILVVDDQADSASALARLLRHESHRVKVAHTVAGAVALAAGAQPIDLLISDIGLPDGNGCDLLLHLREHYRRQDLSAIALTGHGEEHWLEECQRAGYRHFLVKPVVFQDLLKSIAELTRPS